MPFSIIKRPSRKRLEEDPETSQWSDIITLDNSEADFSFVYMWESKVDKFIKLLKQYESIESLNLSNAVIEQKSIIKILDAHLNIKKYDFSGTKFDHTCLPAVANNPKVIQINYRGSSITVEAENELIQILKWRHIGSTLPIPLHRNISILAKTEDWVKYTDQTTAYLSHQGISDRHMQALINFVNDKKINHLDLSNNYITSEGALILVKKLSSKLRILNLSSNPIYDKEIKVIFDQQRAMQIIYTDTFFDSIIHNDNNVESLGGENFNLKYRL